MEFILRSFLDLDRILADMDWVYIVFPGWVLFYFPILLWFGYGGFTWWYCRNRSPEKFFEETKIFRDYISPVLRILFSYIAFIGVYYGLSITNLEVTKNIDNYIFIYFITWILFSPKVLFLKFLRRNDSLLEVTIFRSLIIFYLFQGNEFEGILFCLILFFYYFKIIPRIRASYRSELLDLASNAVDLYVLSIIVAIPNQYSILTSQIPSIYYWLYFLLDIILLFRFYKFFKDYKEYKFNSANTNTKWFKETQINLFLEKQQQMFLFVEIFILVILHLYLPSSNILIENFIFKILKFIIDIGILGTLLSLILNLGRINLGSYLNKSSFKMNAFIYFLLSFLYLHFTWDYNVWVDSILISVLFYLLYFKKLIWVPKLNLKEQFIMSCISTSNDEKFIATRSKQLNSLGKDSLFVPAYHSIIFYFSSFFEGKDFLKFSSHILFFWENKNFNLDDSQRLEWLFRKSFQNPHIVFDSFTLSYHEFESEYPPSYKDPTGRMSFLLILTDETPPPLENLTHKTYTPEQIGLKEKFENLLNISTITTIPYIDLYELGDPLLKELSLDVHKENDFLLKMLEEQGKMKNYGISKILDSFSRNGIFELTLMYRQVFELNNSAARFLGFIDLLECTSLYMVSLLYSESPTGVKFWEKAEDSELESLTFGKCNTLLRKWLKGELKSDLSGIHLGLRSMLLHEFAGLQPLSKLKQFGEEGFGVNYSWTKEETLLDVLEFFSVIRNKTRGHGSPTKIPYYILPPLQMMILFIFKALSDIPGSIICVLKEEEQTFFLDLRSGGLPQFLSKINRETGEEEFDFSNIYDTEEDTTDRKQRTELANEIAIQPDIFEQIYWGNKEESWNISKIVKYHAQRIYLLSDYKKMLYISHSSGDIVRPEQLQEDRKKSNLNTINFLKNSKDEDQYAERERVKKNKIEKENRLRPLIEEESKNPLKNREEILSNLLKNFQSIPSGEFIMGALKQDKESSEIEKPAHKVFISNSFKMGIYPVTQEEWRAVMEYNPSEFKSVGGRAPIESVSWDDIQEFLKKLNELAGLTSEKGYRLPTEAEWEYAARAGTSSIYIHGDDPSLLEEYAWYEKNSDKTTHPVGQKKSNAWGLYDMSGNVWEWCADWYGEDYYKKSIEIDPKGAETGNYRSLRGGSWGYNEGYSRLSYRSYSNPGQRNFLYGFRLVLPNS